MGQFDLIVFDWDGTLLDSAGAIVACIQDAARDLGLEPPPDHLARHVIGLGLSDALSAALPQLDPRDYPKLSERYRHHYLSRDHELALFSGAYELIEILHGAGRTLAVATGKSRRGLDRALAGSGLGRFFSATRCADECHSKPHPQMLLEIMEQIQIEPKRALMIGDTTHDLQMARNAGVAALAVSFGAHPKESLLAQQPLHCAGSIAELKQWISLNA